MSWLSRTLKNVGNSISNAADKAWSGIKTGVTNAADWIGEKATQFGHWVRDTAIPSTAEYLSDVAWNMGSHQREYNEAQKELEYTRSLPVTTQKNLNDAGLNSNLIYGNGAAGATGNYTPNEAESHVDNLSFDVAAKGVDSIMSMIGQFQNFKAISAGIDKTKEATEAQYLKNRQEKALQKYLGIDNYLDGFTDSDGNVHFPTYTEFTRKMKSVIDHLENTAGISRSEYENWRGLLGQFEESPEIFYKLQKALLLAQARGLGSQADYNRNMADRVSKMLDPKIEAGLNFAGDILGDLTQIVTKGVAGGKRNSPSGYYRYGSF